MTLTQALEIIDLNIRQRNPAMPPDVLDALKLGIEAFKMIKDGRSKPGGMFFHDLPGETNE